VALSENGKKKWLLQVAVDVDPDVALVIVTLPQTDAVVVAVNTAPLPVGAVSVIMGGEPAAVQPKPIPA
jgi:hypothetical protein